VRSRFAPRAIRWRAPILVAAVAIAAALPAAAERVLINYQGLQAAVPDGNAWCTAQPTVAVHGKTAADFADTARLEKLLGGLRAALSFECPQAQQVTLVGSAEGADVYKATAAAANGWTLVAQTAATPTADVPTPSATEVAAPEPTVGTPEPTATATSTPAEGAPAAETPAAIATMDAPPASAAQAADAATTFEIPATETTVAPAPGLAGALAGVSMRVWTTVGGAAALLATAAAAFLVLRARKKAPPGGL